MIENQRQFAYTSKKHVEKGQLHYILKRQIRKPRKKYNIVEYNFKGQNSPKYS